MPRVLLVAATTGYQTRSFTAAARRLGIEVILATDRCHILEDPWRDNAIPVRFEEPELAAETLAGSAVVGRSAIDGVIAVADRPTLVAALTAQKLGIPFHSPHSVAACRDKHKMREIFGLAGLPVPENFSVGLDRDPREMARNTGYPCVLKPLGLSASRGVIRANSADEFVAAFERIRRILIQPEIRQFHEEWNEALQIEQYIEGREFALEGLMTRGDLNVLAIFDKPDPLEGPFFEETIYVTPSRESREIQSAIVGTARRAVRALDLDHGPVHAEMRVNAKGVYMLEVAARRSGAFALRTPGARASSGTLLYFDQLCPPDRDGHRKAGERARYIPAVANYQKYYRHLLAGPYRVFRAHRADPDRALILLCGPLHKPGEIVEQIVARQEIITNPQAVALATSMYFDVGSGSFKRGAAGKGSGSARRLADILSQFDVTWDLYSIAVTGLLGKLPREFDRFRPSVV